VKITRGLTYNVKEIVSSFYSSSNSPALVEQVLFFPEEKGEFTKRELLAVIREMMKMEDVYGIL
jgi:hypothetical protein